MQSDQSASSNGLRSAKSNLWGGKWCCRVAIRAITSNGMGGPLTCTYIFIFMVHKCTKEFPESGSYSVLTSHRLGCLPLRVSLHLPWVQPPLQLHGHEISWPFVTVLPKVFMRSPAERERERVIRQWEILDVPAFCARWMSGLCKHLRVAFDTKLACWVVKIYQRHFSDARLTIFRSDRPLPTLSQFWGVAPTLQIGASS